MFNFRKTVYDKGFLKADGNHSIYYQQIGNPKGTPVLMFHGGPGGRSKEEFAKVFDLKKFRVIQFDQRGCGKSQYQDLLKDNTTNDLLDDAIKLWEHLNIGDNAVITGASWGSTLALLFAEKYPQKTLSLVLSLIFLARDSDLAWLRKESRRFYPDIYDEIAKNAPTDNFFDYYTELLNSSDISLQNTAMKYLGCYEGILGQLNPSLKEGMFEEKRIKNSRIFFHYERHNYFMEDDYIIKNCGRLKNIPTIIFHNRMDFCCPVYQAWDLYQALPNANLEIIPDYGHGSKMQLNLMKSKVNAFLKCYQPIK